MSLLGENPEWFDNWIELEALNGRWGVNLQERVLIGDVVGNDLWKDRKDISELLEEAETCFLERLAP